MVGPLTAIRWLALYCSTLQAADADCRHCLLCGCMLSSAGEGCVLHCCLMVLLPPLQVLFLLYHYFDAKEVYNAIRVFIAGYVWLTGYGNFSYYYRSNDFSIGRWAGALAKCLPRHWTSTPSERNARAVLLRLLGRALCCG